jgi:hypothetical protein
MAYFNVASVNICAIGTLRKIMKHLVTILSILLTTFYVSSTNADEPKVSSHNQWIENYNVIRQGQPYMINAFNNYFGRTPVRFYRRPNISFNYYHRPVFIQNNYLLQQQNNYYNSNGFGAFMMNLPSQ